VSSPLDFDHAQLRFALALARELTVGTQDNRCFSPFSIAHALGLLSEFSRGAAERELVRLLAGDSSDIEPEIVDQDFREHVRLLRASTQMAESSSEKALLAVATTLWLDHDLPLASGLDEIVARWPGGSIEKAPLIEFPEESRRGINADVARRTRELISELLPPGALEEDTSATLVNALYLRTAWLKPFSSSNTELGAFQAPSSVHNVRMMRQMERHGYADIEQWQLLELSAFGDLQALVLLPRGDLFEQESTMDSDLLSRLLSAKKEVMVDLTMPKLEVDFRCDLSGALRELGATTMFSEEADLSGLSGDPRLRISDVVHQAVLRVDERGIEGAAATAVTMRLLSTSTAEPIRVRVDRPFLFLVRHNETGVVYFFARVVEP
jgi:serpin B